MNAPLIRRAKLSDAQAVAKVHVTSWQIAYQGLVAQSTLDALDITQRAQGWAEWIESSIVERQTGNTHGDQHQLLVAEIHGSVVGWVTFGAGRMNELAHLGEIAGLYVLPEFWSMGIGHALILRVQQDFLAGGWMDAYLWVLKGNIRAIRFYEGHGWFPDGVEKITKSTDNESLSQVRYTKQLGISLRKRPADC